MKRRIVFFLLASLSVLPLRADEQTRVAQEQLKEQGFYYGEVDGQDGAETNAAIKRFQIRNGLQVTGTLTQETMTALGMSGTAAAAPSPAKKAKSSIPAFTPPPKIVESDRKLLDQVLTQPEQEPTPGNTAPAQPAHPAPGYETGRRDVIPPPVNLYPEETAEDLSRFFARTPYESAPRTVQIETITRAQGILQRRGYYNAMIDGDPGPGTRGALAEYQRDNGLRQTGRLDVDTLLALRLMSGRNPYAYPRAPYGHPSREIYRGEPVYRGIRVY